MSTNSAFVAFLSRYIVEYFRNSNYESSSHVRLAALSFLVVSPVLSVCPIFLTTLTRKDRRIVSVSLSRSSYRPYFWLLHSSQMTGRRAHNSAEIEISTKDIFIKHTRLRRVDAPCTHGIQVLSSQNEPD